MKRRRFTRAVREAVYNKCNGHCAYCGIQIPIVKQAIEAVPAADVAPVVRGHWKKDRDTIKCTVCGFGMFPNRYTFMNGVCVTDNKLPKYCPNCGAKMDGGTP